MLESSRLSTNRKEPSGAAKKSSAEFQRCFSFVPFRGKKVSKKRLQKRPQKGLKMIFYTILIFNTKFLPNSTKILTNLYPNSTMVEFDKKMKNE
jgi:hypothetical protein